MPGRSRPPLRDYRARRIALLKPSALGDIVHSLPVLTALRRRYPQAHITWVVNRSYEPLLRGHCDLDDTLPFDRRPPRAGWWAGVRCWARFLAELRRRRFDLVLDLQGLFRSGLMAAATGAARRVGLSTAREGARWFYTDVVAVADFHAVHAVDRYWLVAEALGGGDGPREFHVPVPEDARRWARAALRGYPRPWLALGPGSRWVTKRWLPEHFAALAGRAQARFGGTVLFVGGRDEAPLAEAVRARLAGPPSTSRGAPPCRSWPPCWRRRTSCWPTTRGRCTWPPPWAGRWSPPILAPGCGSTGPTAPAAGPWRPPSPAGAATASAARAWTAWPS
jgi:ADP-heptose:LPS heptosyltransferase